MNTNWGWTKTWHLNRQRASILTVVFIVILVLPELVCGQNSKHNLSEQIRKVSDIPYICESGTGLGCGDEYFWELVKQQDDAIPFLIELLTDTTPTAAKVIFHGGHYTVAYVAFTVLQELIKDIPTFDLLGVEFDREGCGYCAYWRHLRRDHANRVSFQRAMRAWYEQHKDTMVWIVSEEFLTCECMNKKHPNGGHYEILR